MSVRLALAFFVSLCAFLPGATFEDKIQPILKANCLPCHDQHNRMSGFSIQDAESVRTGGAKHGVAVAAGQPDKSVLIKMLRGRIEPSMPFGKAPLETGDIAAIEQWIEELEPDALTSAGAKHWAFVRPEKGPPPAVRNKEWVRNGIDNFILSKLEEEGLEAAKEADRRVLIRRLYFDLLGVPPPWEEVKAFVADTSLRAYSDLVDRLLGDPRHGERWARHWLDLARYADSNGYEGDPEYYHTWRYRDYVIDAFNDDKPYDQFIKEQIAGNEFAVVRGARVLPPPDPEKVVAMTFLRLAPFTEPRGERSRHELLTEMTSTVGSVFLGLTVGCAQCHDHKYDPIPTDDFYRMKAFFATMQIAPPRPGDIQQLGGPQPAAFYRPGEKDWADKAREKYHKELDELETQFSEFNQPLIERLTAIRKETKGNSDRTPNPKKDGKDDAEPTADDLSKAFQEERENPGEKQHFSVEEEKQFRSFKKRILRLKNAILRVEASAMSVSTADGPPYGPSVPETYVLTRGQWDNPGKGVEPGFLRAIEGHANPAELVKVDRYQRHPGHGRRMTLANWIASPDNPLTARVMVNRLWQYRFGRGIVETSSDFGKNGALPTHPALLDWLALRFVEEKWSIKAMQRLMVSSSTYRQSSREADPKAGQADPDNRLLSRFPRRRLEGEAIRDSVLAVSGRLNSGRGGPPIFPPLPEGLEVELLNFDDFNTWETSHGSSGRRRSIYVFQRRSLSLPILQTFDAPVLTASCERRRDSVTPLQALSMYDGNFASTEARHFAERVRKESSPDVGEQIQRAFQIALGRNPGPAELRQVREFYGSADSQQQASAGLCRVLLNSNEFVYVD